MPKENKVESKIGAIYKKNALNLLLYGFVTGVRATLHTVTIEKAVGMFMEAYELSDEDFNCDSAVASFGKMQKEFINQKN